METWLYIVTLYFIVQCTRGIDFCLSNPCQNGGSCHGRTTGYVCACAAMYTGSHCESQNECGSNPCQNGGHCIDDLNFYVCKCQAGFTGVNCETDINECKDIPCVNGATCSNIPGNYTCVCKDGYSGRHCETDMNECAVSPCRNGGECHNLISGFVCNCPSEYVGVTCEVFNEEYGRRSGIVWTIVAVSVLVVLILITVAITLPITLRRMRRLVVDDESVKADEKRDTIPERKSRVFFIPGLFRKNDKTVKKPIFFKVKRSSSFELQVNGGVTLNDLQTADDPPEKYPSINQSASHEAQGADANSNWYLARFISANGRDILDSTNSAHSSTGDVLVSSNFALNCSLVPPSDGGPHVTHLYVDQSGT